MLGRISIRMKLAIGFSLVIALAIVTGIVASAKVDAVGQLAIDLYNKPLQSMDAGRLAQAGFREVVGDFRLSSHSDPIMAHRALAAYARSRAELDRDLAVAARRANTPAMADRIVRVTSLLKRWDERVQAGSAGDVAAPEIESLASQIQDGLDLFAEDAKAAGFEFVEDVRGQTKTARALTALVSLAMVLGALLIGYGLARDISRPLGTAVAMAESIAAGQLEGELTETRTDETGKLLRAMAVMRTRLRERLAADRRHAEDRLQMETERAEMMTETARVMARSRMRAEEALRDLRAAQAQLVQAEKMASLGGLVAGVAHEINTPIGNVLAASSHLGLRTREALAKFGDNRLKKSDAESYFQTAREAAEIIDSNILRAAELIHGFKQVAVDQTSDLRRRFRLAAYIEEVLISLRPRLKHTPHQVVVRCAAEIEIDTYAGGVAQLLSNLVINALIHAFDDALPGTITITGALDGPELIRLEIADDGRGIPPENLSRIFEPFFTTRRGAGGTGLGLHIVYNIVTQRLGGTIEVASTPGAGTRFTVRLPKTVVVGGNENAEGQDRS